jgi:hypothetical protein
MGAVFCYFTETQHSNPYPDRYPLVKTGVLSEKGKKEEEGRQYLTFDQRIRFK